MQIIDLLADKLNNSPKVPLSNNRIVDAAEIGHLLERLRISVPSSIMESERTLAERERILSEAEAEAKRVIDRAKARAAELLSQDSLVNMARREAERMAEEARNAANQRTEEADIYASQVLEDLNSRLAALTRQVENGLQMMQGRRAEQSRTDAGKGDPGRTGQARSEPARPQQGAWSGDASVNQQQAQYAPRPDGRQSFAEDRSVADLQTPPREMAPAVRSQAKG